MEYAIETKNANKLKQLKKTLTEKLVILAEMDCEIWNAVPEDKVEFEVEKSDMVREKIEDALIEIEEALENLSVLRRHKKSSHHRLLAVVQVLLTTLSFIWSYYQKLRTAEPAKEHVT